MLIGVSLYQSNDVFFIIELSFYIVGYILQNTLQDLSQLSLVPLSTHLLRESMWLRTQSALHGKALMRGRISPECTVCLSVLLTYQLLVMLTKSPPVVIYQPDIILLKRENKIVSFTEHYKRNSWRNSWLTVTSIPRCDTFFISDRILLAVHVVVHFTTMDFINLESARLQRLVWNRTRRWLSLFTNASGRLTRTFPRVN